MKTFRVVKLRRTGKTHYAECHDASLPFAAMWEFVCRGWYFRGEVEEVDEPVTCKHCLRIYPRVYLQEVVHIFEKVYGEDEKDATL